MTATPPAGDTLADLLRQLGAIPPERIRRWPPPGSAKEKDVLSYRQSSQKLRCELIDGVLVEKAIGFKEAVIASLIAWYLWDYLEKHDLGLAFGSDGPIRLKLGLIRYPDAGFVSWQRVPSGSLPDEAISRVVPDLVVEVLSKNNTREEMDRKLHDYFEAGVRLCWLVDPRSQTATVFKSPTDSRRIGKDQFLDGADVLPGLRVPLKELFARAAGKRRPHR
jgi:Uma2 family endonuclease